jgi:hypothetical protein
MTARGLKVKGIYSAPEADGYLFVSRTEGDGRAPENPALAQAAGQISLLQGRRGRFVYGPKAISEEMHDASRGDYALVHFRADRDATQSGSLLGYAAWHRERELGRTVISDLGVDNDLPATAYHQVIGGLVWGCVEVAAGDLEYEVVEVQSRRPTGLGIRIMNDLGIKRQPGGSGVTFYGVAADIVPVLAEVLGENLLSEAGRNAEGS